MDNLEFYPEVDLRDIPLRLITVDEFKLLLEQHPTYQINTLQITEEQFKYYIDHCLYHGINLRKVFSYAVDEDEVSLLRRFPEDYDFFTPYNLEYISYALELGHEDFLDFFLEKGLDVNLQLYSNVTLLERVLFVNEEERPLHIARRLLQCGFSLTTINETTDIVADTIHEPGMNTIFNEIVLAGFDFHYYRSVIWKNICSRYLDFNKLMDKEDSILHLLHGMGITFPIEVAREFKEYGPAFGSEEWGRYPEREDMYFNNLSFLWSNYGESEEELLLPHPTPADN